jgi:hypothetical protein
MNAKKILSPEEVQRKQLNKMKKSELIDMIINMGKVAPCKCSENISKSTIVIYKNEVNGTHGKKAVYIGKTK